MNCKDCGDIIQEYQYSLCLKFDNDKVCCEKCMPEYILNKDFPKNFKWKSLAKMD
jgi:hypothetical protein